MDKKFLLAEATRKLERPSPAPIQSTTNGANEATPETGGATAAKAKKEIGKAEPVVSKGITLRPKNIETLDRLELSLRKKGVKAGHSGLIQIAIERLEDNEELVTAYKQLLKSDLRLK